MDCFEFLIGSEQFYVDNKDWKRSKQILDKETTWKYFIIFWLNGRNIELVW